MIKIATAPTATDRGHSLGEWVAVATSWAERYAASRSLVIAAFTILYLIPTVKLSQMKLFWDDEFFTLYLSRTPDWKTLLQALATGADQHPPSFYYFTHWILQIFGTSHVTLRLTAIAGIWLLCVCMYEIVRPLANPLWAVVAMLFPLTTHLYNYAIEARGYGLVSGFAALAMLSWLRSSSFRERRFYLPVLAFSLAAAVASHYYAGLVAVCLVLGELVRTVSRRKIDWPIWIAFLFTAVPIVAFFRTIQSAKGYSSHFWAIPVWSDAISFYPSELGLGPLALLVTLGIAISFGRGLGDGRTARVAAVKQQRVLKVWEATAICCLSALPLMAMFAAKYVTHGFTNRYAIAAMVGLTILLAYFLHRVTPQPKVALAAAVVCLGVFVFQVHAFAAAFNDHRDDLAANIRDLSATGDQQVAVIGITIFHQLSFYAPRELATRLSYLADADTAIRFMGHDTIDRGLLDLDPWFPLKVIPTQMFLEGKSGFMAYGASTKWNWLTFNLAKWGDTRLLERYGQECMLFSVTKVHFGQNPALLQQQHEAASRMLYWKTPQTGPSLCKVYMGSKGCP